MTDGRVAQAADGPQTFTAVDRRGNPLAFAPGLLMNGATVLAFVAAIWRGSERTNDLATIIPVTLAWSVVLFVWLFRFVAALGEGTLARRDAGRWALGPGLFLVAWIVVFGGWALVARVAMSKDALDAAADAALAGGAIDRGWIGLYRIADVSTNDGSVRFEVVDHAALVRDPPAEEPSAVVWYEPVFGRWSIEHTTFGWPD
jgi:hypothetical protein